MLVLAQSSKVLAREGRQVGVRQLRGSLEQCDRPGVIFLHLCPVCGVELRALQAAERLYARLVLSIQRSRHLQSPRSSQTPQLVIRFAMVPYHLLRELPHFRILCFCRNGCRDGHFSEPALCCL